MFSPIVLFTYNRPSHLKKTVESLLTNRECQESVLYIFSDGPKKNDNKDILKVTEVRNYIKHLEGFKKILLFENKINKGLANNVIEGVTKILQNNESVIVIEDDLEFSNDFLYFMNESLKFYYDNPLISSVSGYSFGLEKLEAKQDVFFTPRASSWGWCTWQNRWNKVDWNISLYDSFLKDKSSIKRFENGGLDLLPMLKKQKIGIINSWAIRWTFYHFVSKTYCVVPKYSKVKNIGTDGSGTNFRYKTNKYLTSINSSKLELITNDLYLDDVQKFNRKKFKVSIIRTIINKINFLFR